MAKPHTGTYAPYFDRYIILVAEDNIAEAFNKQEEIINSFFLSIPAEKHNYSYAPGKWNLKELFQHIIDAERVFQYRALCVARGEKQSLPGFDENDYVNASNAGNRNWESLCNELKMVRASSKILFESFSPDALLREGMANNATCTANAIGFISAGHLQHHVNIIKERYLE